MLIPIVVIAVFSFGDDAERQTHLRARRRLHHRVLEHDLLDPGAERSALHEPAAGGALDRDLDRDRDRDGDRPGPPPFRGRRVANLLIVIPMATPEVVIGASLLSMFIYYSFALGFTTLLIAHVMFSISFVVVVVRSRLIGFDRNLEEAAADLGADAAARPSAPSPCRCSRRGSSPRRCSPSPSRSTTSSSPTSTRGRP